MILVYVHDAGEASLLTDLIASEFGRPTRIAGSADSALDDCEGCSLLLYREVGPVPARLRFVRQAAARNPAMDIVVLGDDESPGAIPFLEAGATCYVAPGAGLADLKEVVQLVERGGSPLDPHVARDVVRRLQELSRLVEDGPVDIGLVRSLTAREGQVSAHLADGRSNAEIGEILGIAVGTVKNHVHSILEKLGVATRHQAGSYWRIFHDGDGRGSNGDGRGGDADRPEGQWRRAARDRSPAPARRITPPSPRP